MVPALICIAMVLVSVVIGAEHDGTEKPVVYLIGDLNGNFRHSPIKTNGTEDGVEKQGILLQDPIPDDEALEDGVYFRPADGKPVDRDQASTFLTFKKLRVIRVN